MAQPGSLRWQPGHQRSTVTWAAAKSKSVLGEFLPPSVPLLVHHPDLLHHQRCSLSLRHLGRLGVPTVSTDEASDSGVREEPSSLFSRVYLLISAIF